MNIKGWRCGYCLVDNLVIFTSDMTSNYRRHLLSTHGINVDLGGTKASKVEEVTPVKHQYSLLNIVNINDFYFYLLRWIVECHIPFLVVKD